MKTITWLILCPKIQLVFRGLLLWVRMRVELPYTCPFGFLFILTGQSSGPNGDTGFTKTVKSVENDWRSWHSSLHAHSFCVSYKPKAALESLRLGPQVFSTGVRIHTLGLRVVSSIDSPKRGSQFEREPCELTYIDRTAFSQPIGTRESTYVFEKTISMNIIIHD